VVVTTVAQLLRQETLLTHRRVESQLGLLEPGLSAARLTSVIERFYGFWAGNEPGIEEWALAEPGAASALLWPCRRRAGLFAEALVRLGMSSESYRALPQAPPAHLVVDHAVVFGWLYVTEGSTLGGALIDRHLRTLTWLDGTALGCFTPYGDAPGVMWRSYKSALQAFVSEHPDRTDTVVAAAVATFGSLERWLTPLSAAAPV
jgi:heme oxygenase